MLPERRAEMFGSGNSGGLPSGYQEVEWISGTRSGDTSEVTQIIYIDTGIKMDGTSRVVIDTEFISMAGYRFFGAWTSLTEKRFSMNFGASPSPLNFGYNNSTVGTIPKEDISLNDMHTFDFRPGEVSMDGVQRFTFSPKSFTCDCNAYLLNVNAAGNPTVPLYYKQGKCRIYQNDILVRDFVPCYRISDGAIGMYDLCGSASPFDGTPFYCTPVYANTMKKGADVL